ncbi:MAG: phenylalanine--tRNA ligase subunit beta [Candidatus Magasanikbacteria bacterium]|jgi:phenylalanyl-tRNA synthetase beta chain|nr:phenylalanine--tRNA ligase subunit beta [Candidatus Magasanikbacteria bacterium]MBT4221501.1 phenylalanine--tRNA ligase subunit beta [Candidatus Magasanikbacteria bacterium]MBT4350452.1 phenylalanine--tRNA ligase subunit beta [Candidatus Magasanikbacteria bacterium]MBT4541839.1 phenylalanine--tRNA ligase subunit beta [Candidatus Magasanikbacteria bacterium]MBT6253368.1 phenylalanine--tRNA ligase subunit beta [Candidatus Magasanikbacteria bacterium]
MRISKKWLQDFVFLPDNVSSEKLGEDLTLKVVEVEEIINQASALEGIVVGKIKEIKKHEDADALSVCHVDIGEKNDVQIVCGGSNLKEGMTIAFGKVGAHVRWHGEGDLVELKPIKIRGVESHGMVCAADEIGLGDMFSKKDEKEILDISHIDAAPGTPLAEALGVDDTIIDVENKTMTHRPDLWGHYGIAREVAAMYRKKLKEYAPPSIKEGKQHTLHVDIKTPDVCRRASFVRVDGIEIGESPSWIKERLIAVGLRPINNIVDITNYVMYDLGQPMHAHDADKIEEGTLIIRYAKKDEPFETLDKKALKLSESMLVIADKKKAVALAGVMGGSASDIHDGTKSIILEAANFDATTVRKAAQACGLRTDASTRFEKTLDPNMTILALQKAVALIKECCKDAHVTSNIADTFKPNKKRDINLPMTFLRQKMGIEIEEKQVVNILEHLGFSVKAKRGTLFVTPPTWRATKDVTIREDLVEEVARMYGYDNIPTSLPNFAITPPPKNLLRDTVNNMKKIIAYECGYTEVYNYSFVSPELLKKVGESVDDHIELANPIAKDRPYVRRNLVPGLLENVEKNAHRFDKIKIFEIGKTFLKDEPGERADKNGNDLLPKQDTYLGFAFMDKENKVPFFEAANTVRAIAKRLQVEVTFKKMEIETLLVHPGRAADIYVKDVMVGRIAEVHPVVQEDMGIPHKTAIVQINVNTLITTITEESNYRPLPVYPVILRDIAFTVSQNVIHDDVVSTIVAIDPLITKVELFDVYEGEHVEDGQKSMAYHLEYRSDKRTLEAKEIDSVHEKVIKALETSYSAQIRA